MPTGIYSKGYKKKPGSTPTRVTAPSRHSGGTSGDLSIPGRPSRTPTIPYSPGGPPTPVQQEIRHETAQPSSGGSTSPADRYLFSRLADLLTPGPTAAEIAQAASALGVKPKALSAGVSGAVSGVEQGIKTLAKDAAEGIKEAAGLPKQRVSHVLDRRTLGTPTVGQLLQAAKQDQLQVNQRGKLTVPATRAAARNLQRAQKGAAGSGHIDGVTHSNQAERFANALWRFSGPPGNRISPKAAGAWTQAEGGGWGGVGVSGGEAGKNNWLGVGYPGEKTPFSESPYFNGSPEQAAKATIAWMEGKIGSDYNYHAAPSIETILPRSRGKGAQAFLQALGASGWGTDVASVAQNLPSISVTPANQKAMQGLAAAKADAERLGIPTKAAGGDLERGGGQVIYVRADSKGMVDWAESVVGTQEGSRRQTHWSELVGGVTDPWCAVFISAGLQRRGIDPPPNPNYSGAFLDPAWKGGTNLNTTDLRKAKPGDILVFDWGDGGQTDHTALYVGKGEMVGGNESDQVGRGPVPADNVVGIARPHYRGGKVAVRESTPLPGSAVGSEGLSSLPAGAAVEGPGVAASGASTARPPAPAVALGAVPVSPLLDVHTPLPRAFGQFQLGEGSQEESPLDEGVIARILRGRRR